MSDIKMSYAKAPPCKWTFKIAPIKELVERYVGDGMSWVDPFAGKSRYAHYRNDINVEMGQPFCMLADSFCEYLTIGDSGFDGILFDPPYSYRQVTEAYSKAGLKATSIDTSNNFYNRVMNAICDKIRPEGYAISFGWNTNGFGVNRGFRPVEILVVAHGQHHNDTLVVVERKDKYRVMWSE